MTPIEILELERLKIIYFLRQYRTAEEQHYVWKAIDKAEKELIEIETAISILKREVIREGEK